MVVLSDRAIRSLKDDGLGRLPFIKRLIPALVHKKTNRATGVVVGIVGEWGSGKSSVLNMLDQEIHAVFSEALVVRFDPWLVTGRDDLIQVFLKQLIYSIPTDGALSDKLKPFKEKFIKYGGSIKGIAGLFHTGAGEVIEAALNSGNDIHSLRGELTVLLEKIDVPIIVLIDELDRVDEDEVHAVAQLVRSVMDFPGISYVLAYDEKRVMHALGRGDEERGRAYLEKIVQFPISLPLAFEAELISMFEVQLKAVIADIGIDAAIFTGARYDALKKILFPDILSTARDIKRAAGMFHVIAGMVGQEVDGVDLLAFTVLQAKAPSTAALIRENYEIYTDDGLGARSIVLHIEEKDASVEERREKRIAPIDRTTSITALMGFLFPVISSVSRQADSTPRSFLYTRPLLTALRLGLLPGALSANDVRELLKKPVSEITEFFRHNYQSEEYPEIWQSIWDAYLYEVFSKTEQLSFWSALSEFSRKRDGEWCGHYSPMRNVIESFVDLYKQKFFMREGAGSETEGGIQDIGRSIIQRLFEEGDVDIISLIVRQHIFHYGLFGWAERPVSAILTQQQSIDLAEKIVAIQMPRLLSGELLKSIWVADVLYLLRDVSGGLSAEAREVFDKHVEDDDALPAISLFFNGQYYASDADTLNNYFDLEAFKKRAQEKLDLDNAGSIELDDSLKSSYSKVINGPY